MSLYRFPVIIEKDKDGYFSYCPALQGYYTQGDTYEEVLENTRDAGFRGQRPIFFSMFKNSNDISVFHGPVKAVPRWIYGIGK